MLVYVDVWFCPTSSYIFLLRFLLLRAALQHSAVRLKCQQGYERGEKTEEVYGDHAAGTGSVCLPDGASLFGRRTVPLHCSTPLPSCISCSHVGINPFAED